MTRWTDAQESIAQIDIKKHPEVKEALWNLYKLIRHTYDVIPEVE